MRSPPTAQEQPIARAQANGVEMRIVSPDAHAVGQLGGTADEAWLPWRTGIFFGSGRLSRSSRLGVVQSIPKGDKDEL